MARVCTITGKRPTTGNNVSHSKRHTKRRILINLQSKRLVNPATGETMRVKLSASALRTLNKWKAEGRVYDLRKLVNS
jgi:large subunit ribosomal protein L28